MSNKKELIQKRRPIIVGETRHYPSGIKQWPSNIYGFNKTSLKNLPIKDKIISKLIKSYFNLSNEKNLARSKRMRTLIRRSSSKKLFVSKAEIKHTNDKAIVTIYIMNRQKQFLLRKMYNFNRNIYLDNTWKKTKFLGLNNNCKANTFKKEKLNNFSISNVNNTAKNYIVNIYKNKAFNSLNFKKIFSLNKALLLRKAKDINYLSNPKIFLKKSDTYFNIKLNNEIKFFLFRLDRKIENLPNLFLNQFLRATLHLFKVNPSSLHLNLKAINLDYIKPANLHGNNKKIKSNLFELIVFLDNVLTKTNVQFTTEKLFFLFRSFYKKYYFSFKYKLLKKKALIINFYVKYLINEFKFNKFLPKLKILVSNLLNKKIELNIVNLKYLHLNSDIFVDSIAMKSRRITSISKILKKSLSLAKTPERFYNINKLSYMNKLQSLNFYKTLDVNTLHSIFNMYNYSHFAAKNHINKDIISVFLKNLYPYFLVQSNKHNETQTANTKKIISKKLKILTSIKYKWLSGIRLEAAGRLTRRFTASRSIYTFKYKGNLKNLDYYKRSFFSKENISTVMLRNSTKANSQYTFVKSKRRIGAFGIKGWISSY